MTDTTYNGWTNRATWLVNLWWGDDLQAYRKDEGEALEDLDVKEYIQNMVDYQLDTHSPESAFLLDMVYEALDDVNWQEIAAAANEE
jgi:hypothetical protein